MPRSAYAAIVVAVTACHTEPSPRQRVLERLPGAAEIVLVADGPALADPALRPLVDAMRPGLPERFGCVLDMALRADAVGMTSDHATGVTLVLAGNATPHHCAALSEIAPGLWSATIGAGAPVTTHAGAVAGDPRWQRARRYLDDAPIALAGTSSGRDLVGALQPAPFSAWVAIDAPDAEQVEIGARAAVAGMTSTHLDRKGSQVTISVDARDRDTVVKALRELAVRKVWRAFEASSPPDAAHEADDYACPASDDPDVVTCSGTTLTVRTLHALVRDLASIATAPIGNNGDVLGLRLVEAGPIGLHRGDIVMAVGATRISQRGDFAVAAANDHTTLTIRRGARDFVLDLRQE